LDLASLFGRDVRRYWLEIGFGGGEHLAMQAVRHPEVGFIGAEVFVNGVASLLGHIERLGLANIRIHAADVRPLLARLPLGALERAFLLFPDPWPKARHARRRFISGENLDLLARILEPGGELRIATDDSGYLAWTLQQLSIRSDFEGPAGSPENWRLRPADWPETRYEEKAIAAGRAPVYLRFRRRSAMADPGTSDPLETGCGVSGNGYSAAQS